MVNCEETCGFPDPHRLNSTFWDLPASPQLSILPSQIIHISSRAAPPDPILAGQLWGRAVELASQSWAYALPFPDFSIMRAADPLFKITFFRKIGKISSNRSYRTLIQFFFKKQNVSCSSMHHTPSMIDPAVEPPCRLVSEKYRVLFNLCGSGKPQVSSQFTMQRGPLLLRVFYIQILYNTVYKLYLEYIFFCIKIRYHSMFFAPH